MTASFNATFENPEIGPPRNQPNSRPRILVVEDEHDLRQLTAEVLIDAGYQVEVAENGDTAWSALQLSKPDLLIADQFMPKAAGVKLLRKIHAARMSVPVIMTTRFLPVWGLALHTWLQPVKILHKPCSFQKLLATVKNTLDTTDNGSEGLKRPSLPPESPCNNCPADD